MSQARLRFNDTVFFFETSIDEWSNETQGDSHPVKVVVVPTEGLVRMGNADNVNSDMTIYADPTDSWIIGRGYRLEGVPVIVNTLGGTIAQQWYTVTKCIPAKDSLRKNLIRHVECILEKRAPLEGTWPTS